MTAAASNGAVFVGDQAQVTRASASRSAAELRSMRKSLMEWLKYRQMNDALASGQPLPRAMLAKPGARPLPPAQMQRVLAAQRCDGEGELAAQLYALLSEVFDARQIPAPDSPDAAVKLALIAVTGRLPGEQCAPEEQGFIWLWPMVIVVGAITWVITSSIRNKAEVEKEREKYECIKAGACTDTGFWLKAAAIGGLAWLAWTKLGLRERFAGRGRKAA